jgi:hypothetical protein
LREEQAAPGGHRVAGVGREIHQRLLDLCAIDEDRPEIRIEREHDLDRLAKGPPQQSLPLTDDDVEIHDLGRDGTRGAGA